MVFVYDVLLRDWFVHVSFRLDVLKSIYSLAFSVWLSYLYFYLREVAGYLFRIVLVGSKKCNSIRNKFINRSVSL